MGAALTQAQSWLLKRRKDLPAVDRDFIDQSAKRESKVRARARRVRALIYALFVGIITGLAWIGQSYVKQQINSFIMRTTNFGAYGLADQVELALKAQASFRECAKECPEMIVIPPSEFAMGSLATENGHDDIECPQHLIARPFAMSKFDVTFADWDACVSVGGCRQVVNSDPRQGTKPVTNVAWADAQQYVAWPSSMWRGYLR